MSYIQEHLMPNEKLHFTARIHLAILLPSLLLSIFSILIFIYGLSYMIVFRTPNNPSPEINSRAAIGGMFLLCFSVGFFLGAIVLGLKGLITLFTTEFGVTNRRVIAKTGFIRRHTLELLLQKIESVAVRQNILGRILNFGTVTLTGTGGTRESFYGIGEPISVRMKINQIIENTMQAQNQFQHQAEPKI